ncbi:hypothetical protein [Nocardioides nanhaiensis]|uniref:Uncharacterized protein n=1 Tax=Nocardioides nanhaiensis TaxID=1476871 RepID=A0ABP8W0A8_9ACTN
MLGRTRRRPRLPAVAARYARVLDGRTLWIALEEAPPTVTLRYPGGELVEPTESEAGAAVAPDDVGLVSARVPLAPLTEPPGESLRVQVLAGDGRHAAAVSWIESTAPGPVRAAMPTPDGAWRWHLGAQDGFLELTRERLEPPPATAVVERVLAHDDGRGARLELRDGPPLDVRASEHDHLAPGESTALVAGGHELVRRVDDLRRPQQAVPLPLLGEGLRMRWDAEARLVVVRERP